jgi:hypothetical protein
MATAKYAAMEPTMSRMGGATGRRATAGASRA